MKSILFTFDIEEFDLPLEFGKHISEKDQFEISKEGTEKIMDLLNKNNIKATFFVSAKFADKHPELIEKISMNHEIGLHCLEHRDDYSNMDKNMAYSRIKMAKEIIEKIVNKKIVGFRAPRFQPPNYKILDDLGIVYDSSLHPTYIPKRYNNFKSPRTPFYRDGIKIIPLTVSPILRLPIFWIAFRNLPLSYSEYITNRNKDYVNLIFHPWEFVDITEMDLPKLITRNTGEKLIKKLQKYITSYEGCNFTTMSSYLLTS